MVSERTKRSGYKMLMGAVVAASLIAGFGAVPSAKADGWHGGDRHGGWDRGHGWDHRGPWFGFGYRPYGYGYYPPPPVYYAPPPPRVYYAPPAYYPGYYPGSFNVTIPIR